MPAASTLNQSFGAAATQFAEAALAAAADATALYRVIYGLDDGNDYGRYFYGQNPLVTFADAATSLSGLIAQEVTQQQTVLAAAEALVAVDTDIANFGPAADALTEAVRTACANPADAVRLLLELCSFTATINSGGIADDPIGEQLYLLGSIAASWLRLAAAASLVRATADYQPTSREDALDIADQVGTVLDALATFCADIFDDATATALFEARTAVVADLQTRGAALADVTTVQYRAPMPALVIAYRLYGDATRAGDVLARNNLVPHPGFMPLELEVLTS